MGLQERRHTRQETWKEASMSNRKKVRAMQREYMNKREKQVAKEGGMPKGLRQYVKRLGSLPSIVQQEYKKYPE